MNLGEFKTHVRLTLGNMGTDDPYDSILTWAINQAVRDLPMLVFSLDKQNVNHFPELRGQWRLLTVDGVSEYTFAENLLVPTGMFSMDTATYPFPSGTSAADVIYVDPATFELLNPDASNYPSHWTVIGTKIKLSPTPTATTTTYVRIHGIRLEPLMTVDADSPALRDYWHDAVVDLAAGIIAGKKGWQAKEKFLTDKAKEKVGSKLAPLSLLGSPRYDARMKLAINPLEWDYYGPRG